MAAGRHAAPDLVPPTHTQSQPPTRGALSGFVSACHVKEQTNCVARAAILDQTGSLDVVRSQPFSLSEARVLQHPAACQSHGPQEVYCRCSSDSGKGEEGVPGEAALHTVLKNVADGVIWLQASRHQGRPGGQDRGGDVVA